MNAPSILVVALLALGAVGCGFAYPVGADRARPLVLDDAERDLDCPAKSIRVIEGLGGTFEAIGCGRTMRYRAACEGVRCVVHREDEPIVPSRDRPDMGDVPR
jgi:hypothetical protein